MANARARQRLGESGPAFRVRDGAKLRASRRRNRGQLLNIGVRGQRDNTKGALRRALDQVQRGAPNRSGRAQVC
jgi:hypothetical protein